MDFKLFFKHFMKNKFSNDHMTSMDLRDLEVTDLCHVNEHSWYLLTYLWRHRRGELLSGGANVLPSPSTTTYDGGFWRCRFKYVQSNSSLNYTERSAVGVAVLISPWNLPLYLLTFKMAPALACGNTVVCKPSEMTSVTAWMLCDLIRQAGACYHGPWWWDFSCINGFSMPRCTQCRDLGLTITSDLSSSQHINEITFKAHKRANCILRCFASRGVSLLVRAFTVYVRPILEYNSVIWSPYLKKRNLSDRESPEAFYKEAAGAPRCCIYWTT